MNWILENKEWIFSGIGVFFISFFAAFLFKKNKYKNIKQSIKSGDNSKNIQSSGNVTLHIGQKNEE